MSTGGAAAAFSGGVGASTPRLPSEATAASFTSDDGRDRKEPMKQLVAMVAITAFLPLEPVVAQGAPPSLVEVPAPAEPAPIPLYGDATPETTASEIWGADNRFVRNVTRPTLTPVLPKPDKANGAAIIVAPGGAFMGLAMDIEGWPIARALADRGIAAFVLKYRVIPTPKDEVEAMAFAKQKMADAMTDPTKMPNLQFPPATDDALAALAMVRVRAAEWNVDPGRVGMIGFSAGALTSLNATLTAKRGEGPAFLGYIYGPQAQVAVPAEAPPMFAAVTFDDQLVPTMGFPIVEAWHHAGRPVELHAYGRGGHGFGLGRPGTTPSLMLDEFVAWLGMEGFLAPKDER